MKKNTILALPTLLFQYYQAPNYIHLPFYKIAFKAELSHGQDKGQQYHQ